MERLGTDYVNDRMLSIFLLDFPIVYLNSDNIGLKVAILEHKNHRQN